MIEVRKAQKEDKETFIELCLALTNFNTKHFRKNRHKNDDLKERLRKRREKSIKIFEEHWGKENIIIFIAVLNNKAVGYAIAYIFDEVYGYLDEMYVDESARRLGIGKKLLNTFEEWAKVMKAEKLKLNVFLWNENAINLYEKEDYKGHFLGYIKEL